MLIEESTAIGIAGGSFLCHGKCDVFSVTQKGLSGRSVRMRVVV